HILHPALCSLPRVMREAPVRVLVGGEFADQTCGQHGSAPDWARATPPWRMAATALRSDKPARFALRGARHRVRDWGRQPVLPFPPQLLTTDPAGGTAFELFDGQVVDEYRTWWRIQQQTLAVDRAPWRDLALYVREMSEAVAMNWEACSALGIRRSFPFYTRE